jgi:putative ABC transport system permease protein
MVRVTPYSAEFARDRASEIKDRLAKEGIGVGFTSYQDPEEHWGRFFIEGINLVLQVLAVVSLFMSVILVTNTMTALITQQINQIGMIKAIGGGTGTILKIYLATVLIYGLLALLISLLPGAIVAFGISQWFLNLFNIDYDLFQISLRAVTYQAIAATLIPALAALWPVLSGAAITVREAIASYGLGGDFGFSWLIAVPLSFALAQPLANALGQAMFDANLDYQYNYLAVLVWLVIVLVISTLASILPARSAMQISVRDSLAYV